MSGPHEDLVRSVHARLVSHAKRIHVDPNLVLTRFAVERFLYRERRRTPIPDTAPLALTPRFAEVEGKRRQWEAFLDRNRIDAPAESLDAVVRKIAVFLGPVLTAARVDGPFAMSWPAGGPWQPVV